MDIYIYIIISIIYFNIYNSTLNIFLVTLILEFTEYKNRNVAIKAEQFLVVYDKNATWFGYPIYYLSTIFSWIIYTLR